MGGSGNWLTIVGVRASTPLGSAASSRWVKKLKRELFPVEYFGRCTFIRCIERQNFGAGDHLGQLPERTLLSRHRKHARAIANRGFHNPPSDPSAAADHDHVLACQSRHSVHLVLGGHADAPHV
jgi:hypothetical protein